MGDGASQVALLVYTRLPDAGDKMRHGLDPWVGRSLGGRCGNSSILGWRIQWTEEPLVGYSL